MTRAFNFSPGPAALPEAVLEQAQAELLLSGHRAFRAGDEPPVFRVHRNRRLCRGRLPRALGHRRRLSRPLPARRSLAAVRAGAAEPCRAGRHRRLHPHRLLGHQGHQGGVAACARACGGVFGGAELHLHPTRCRMAADAERRLLPHHHQRDHRRRAVPRLSRRWRPLGGGHVVGDPLPSGGRLALWPHLRRRAEEHRSCRTRRRGGAQGSRRQGAARARRRSSTTPFTPPRTPCSTLRPRSPGISPGSCSPG